MFQPEACSKIAKSAKELGLSVWTYSGFKIEELLKMAESNEGMKEFLNNIDVLIDGKFKIEEKSMNLYYRGSKNQRVLDMKKTLEKNKPVIIEKYMKEKPIHSFLYKNRFQEAGVFI